MEKQDFTQYTEKQLAELVGDECYIMFDRLNRFILDNYNVSKVWAKGGKYGEVCLRYSRSKKTLCTVYFRRMQLSIWVILGKQERERFEAEKSRFFPAVRDKYESAQTFHDGKWLMFDVENADLLDDIKGLIEIKKKPDSLKLKQSGQSDRGKSAKAASCTDKLDYKKEYKDLYQPSAKPSLINVPEMLFIAVDGKGDPNTCDEYRQAIEILYGLSFTIKMSKLGGNAPEGYFEYVVPPLEGLWRQEGIDGIDYARKSDFLWTSMIRQPEFVTEAVFRSAVAALTKKKPHLDLNKARLMKYDEGLCVQIMHRGAYDNEPQSIEKMRKFAEENGYIADFSDARRHHEIYLSDPRRCASEKLKTVIRHPVKRGE